MEGLDAANRMKRQSCNWATMGSGNDWGGGDGIEKSVDVNQDQGNKILKRIFAKMKICDAI